MTKLQVVCAILLASAALAACEEDNGDDASSTSAGESSRNDDKQAGRAGDSSSQAGRGGTQAGGDASRMEDAAGSSGRAGRGGRSGSAGSAGEPPRVDAGSADEKPEADGGSSDASADIVDTALAAGNFKQLADALTRAGLVDALKGDGPFTVFAPTDAAFAAFEKDNPGVLAAMSKEQLTKLLQYHVLSGAEVRASDLKNGQLAVTLAGPVVAIDLSGSAPRVNAATVTMADIAADNGVIHAIDKLLVPPGNIVEVATAAGKFGALAKALTDAGLVETLQGKGPFTVFAPTDDAFAALGAVPTGDALKSVLTYHVLPGIVGPLDLVDGGVAVTVNGAPVAFDLSDGAKINGVTISATNVVASNGVIHVIDAVIVPPKDDIVATAVAAGDFTALTGALTDAGLVPTLQGAGPFTVFAPTDAAFAALPAVPSGDALKNVLLYHVVKGAIGAGNLRAGELETLSGGKVSMAVEGGVRVNSAHVTKANILTRNGVIHVIDAVLLPE